MRRSRGMSPWMLFWLKAALLSVLSFGFYWNFAFFRTLSREFDPNMSAQLRMMAFSNHRHAKPLVALNPPFLRTHPPQPEQEDSSDPMAATDEEPWSMAFSNADSDTSAETPPTAQAEAEPEPEPEPEPPSLLLEQTIMKNEPPPPPIDPPVSSPPSRTKVWFLDPKFYQEESGCDLSAAVEKFDPSQLEINCSNFDQLSLEEFIGEGYWREVYRAKWKGHDVAVKIVKDYLLDRSDIVTRHVEEASVMFQIRNEPNIVSLFGWCNSSVIVDYVPYSLADLLFESDEPLPVKRALELALDAARGVMQFHQAPGGPYAHADLQPRQFLIDASGKLLLNDFNRIKYTGKRREGGVDLERFTRPMCRFLSPVAKGKWRSPEEYEKKALDEKVDIYSLSYVFWALRARQKPFPDLEKDQVYEQVLHEQLRPPLTQMSDWPLQMQNLVLDCWQEDPQLRPSAAEVVARIEKILQQYEQDESDAVE